MRRLGGGLLGAGALPIPGQEFIDPFSRMILQARQDIGEPGLRVNVVEFGRFDQGVDGGGATAAIVRRGFIVPAV